MNAPDYPSAIRAFRIWGVTGDGRRLQSTAAGFWSTMPAWRPGARLEARCLTPRACPDGGIPGLLHRCGIYGLKSFDAAVDWARHVGRVRSTVVIGEVALWGTVVESARGWRAQYAYPARFLEATTRRGRRPLDLAELGGVYAVPIGEPSLV